MIQSFWQIPISLHFIMALSSNSSFEQQNQFVTLSAALAGRSEDMSHLPQNNPTMEEDSSVFLLHAPGGAKFRHAHTFN